MKFYSAIQKNAIISFEGKLKKLRLGDLTVVVCMLEAESQVATQSIKESLLNTWKIPGMSLYCVSPPWNLNNLDSDLIIGWRQENR